MSDTAFQWGFTVLSTTLLARLAYRDNQRESIDLLMPTFREHGSFVAQSFCPNGEDYSPCSCKGDYLSEYDTELDCVFKVTPKRIKEVFQSVVPAEVGKIVMSITMDVTIPEDVFVNHRIVEMSILCIAKPNGVKPRLNIHPDAFRSSRNVTWSFHSSHCDMSMLDFNFLVGFYQLQRLNIHTSTNVHLTNLLLAPLSLNTLGMMDVTWFDGPGITSTKNTNELSPLQNVYLEECDLNDDKAAQILDWILTNSLNGSQVERLYLSRNQLTRIPPQIKSFSKLNYLSLKDQHGPGINVVSALSLPIIPSLWELELQSSNIKEIEPGAFKVAHNNKNAVRIILSGNGLTRLSAAVFEEIFQHILLYGGKIFLSGNPFNCTDICHLSWLLRDHKELLDVAGSYYTDDGPTCANGTELLYLHLKRFTHCP